MRLIVVSLAELLRRGLMIVAGLCFCVMAIHVTADVFMKYLFRHPIVGTLESVTYYYMVAAVFLPLAAVLDEPCLYA